MNFNRCMTAGWFLADAALVLLLSAVAARGDAADDLRSLIDEYTAHYDAGRYREAMPSARRALEIAEKEHADNPKILGECAFRLASLHEVLQDIPTAITLYTRALKLAEEGHGKGHAQVGYCLNNLALLHHKQGRFAESEAMQRRALTIKQKALGEDHPHVAGSCTNLGALFSDQGRFDEAEAMHRRALAIYEKAYSPTHALVARSIHNIAVGFSDQGRFDEAEPLLKSALRIKEQALGADHPGTAYSLHALGAFYSELGRYAEAEPVLRRALRVQEDRFGRDHPTVANTLNSLAIGNSAQRKNDAAETLFLRSIAIYEDAYGPVNIELARPLNNLSNLYDSQGKSAEAIKLLERCVDIYEDQLGPKHQQLAVTLSNLAFSYLGANDSIKAEALFRRALEIAETSQGREHPDVATALFGLAKLNFERGKLDEAEKHINRVIQIRDRPSRSAADDRAYSYDLKARILHKQGKLVAACNELRHAIELAEQQRARFSGSGDDRAAGFSLFGSMFEMMVAWQSERGDINQALAAMERGHARSLVDLIQMHGADLLAGLPPEEAAALKRRDVAAKSRLASIARQLDSLDANKSFTGVERERRRVALRRELAEARTETVEAYRAIHNASPAVRLALGSELNAIDSAALDKWVREQNGVLLQYFIGEWRGFLLIVGADGEPRLVTLHVGEEQAERLGTTAGPLTVERLGEAMRVGEQEIQQRLSRPQLDEKVIDRLAGLYKLLIPEAVRGTITGDEMKRLFVIPDGSLATLPFEVLVTEAREAPRYLLDDGPPIVYAPSSTLLVNLHGQPAADSPAEGFQVLSVADPVYGGARKDDSAFITPSSRYAAVGGRLAELPHTATESSWIGKLFQDAGLRPGYLHKEKATEAALRRYASGRKIVHVACHGLVDQQYGNFFGSLALTPGRSSAGTSDDGFLTLPEIYELDLDGCELTILSACSTNFGPTRKGEGVWALSRGFLVAGSRRVVASNWLVDDKAAASLISYYCGFIANAERKGEPTDYAAALHAAKRWSRAQDAWQSPYYWAPFVHVGPP